MKASVIPIEDYVRLKEGARTVRVHPEFSESVGQTLLRGGALGESEHAGRAPMARIETERGIVLVRRYQRGGAVKRFIRGRYFLSDRPAKELRVHATASGRGVSTAIPVAALSEWCGPWCSGAYATVAIDAPDLLRYVQTSGDAAESGLAACGVAVRAMHDAGIWHADLQVKNLLTNGDRAWIIDFDRAKARHGLSLAQRQNNLQRLRRSFLKLNLDLAGFETLVRAYESGEESNS